MSTAERWANDYLQLTHEQLIEKYNLHVRLGDSVLAAMFEAFRANAERFDAGLILK